MGKSLEKKVSLILGLKDGELRAGLNRLETSLKGFSDYTLRMLKRVAVIGFIGISAAVVKVGKDIFQTGIQFEKFEMQLKVLYGSARKAEEVFKWIKEFAATTPFELPEIVQATVMLKAFGLEAKNVLKDIGDLASGMQVDLQFAVDAFGRLKAGNFGEAFEKFRRMGIGTQKLIAEGLRFDAGGQLLDKSAEGINRAITSIQRIIRRDFPDLMQEQAKTMGGILSNIADYWTQMRAKIAEKILPTIKKDLKSIADFMGISLESGNFDIIAEKIGDKFLLIYESIKQWVKTTYEWGKDKLPIILGAVKEFAETIWPFFKVAAENIDKILIVAVLTKALTLAKDLAGVVTAIAGSAVFSKMLAFFGSTAGTIVAGGAGVALMGGLSIQESVKRKEEAQREDEWRKLAGAFAGKPLDTQNPYFPSEATYVKTIPIPSSILQEGGMTPEKITEDIVSSGGITPFIETESQGSPHVITEVEAGFPMFEKLSEASERYMEQETAREELMKNLKLQVADEYTAERLTIEQEYQDTLLAIDQANFENKTEQWLAETLAYDAKVKRLTAINKKQKEDEAKEDLKTMQRRAKVANFLMDVESAYAKHRGNIGRAMAELAIRQVTDEVSGWLKMKAIQWGAAALADLARYDFWAAAKHTAAAAAAGAGAIAVSSLGNAWAEKQVKSSSGTSIPTETIPEISNFDTESPTENEASHTYGGIVRGQPINITIAPSVTISGDTIFVGNSSITEMYGGIAEVAVNAVRQAIEDGDINISKAVG